MVTNDRRLSASFKEFSEVWNWGCELTAAKSRSELARARFCTLDPKAKRRSKFCNKAHFESLD